MTIVGVDEVANFTPEQLDVLFERVKNRPPTGLRFFAKQTCRHEWNLDPWFLSLKVDEELVLIREVYWFTRVGWA